MPEAEDIPRKHVAVLAFPFGTHAAPLLSLTQMLSDASSDVKFSFFSTAASNNKRFPMSGPVTSINRCDVDDGLPPDFVFKGNPLEVIEMFLEGAQVNFRKAMDLAVAETGKEIGFLISDAFLWFVGEMAKEMQVPWVPLWTSGPHSLTVHLYTDLIRQSLGSSGLNGKTLDFVPGLSAIHVADFPDGVVEGDLESPFATMLHRMGQTLPKATAVAINSFEELDLELVNHLKSAVGNFLNVGPLNLMCTAPSTSDEHDCLAWLDTHKPESVAYISFGSFLNLPHNELSAVAEALEESGHPFLWSFRGNPDEKLPERFLEATDARGKIVPWAPQSLVLEHPSVGVFITHGGWNSILESISGGTPLICRPFVGDQKLNMTLLEVVLGIGFGAEGGVFTKSGLMKALEAVLSGEEGKRMRKNAAAIREVALTAAKSGGSSSRNLGSLVELVSL